jgi:hypothetical protein
MRRIYQLEDEEEVKNRVVLEPRVCPNCHMIMPPVADYCAVCGEHLGNETPANEDEIQAFVLEHGQELIEYLLNNKKSGKQGPTSQSYLTMLAPKI